MHTGNLVQKAIENEIKAKVFYGKAADMTNVGESHMVFLELVEMEDGHARLLVDRFGDLLAEAGVDGRAFLESHESATTEVLNVEETALLSDGDMAEVIRYAIGLEILARDGYRDLGARINNEPISKMCKDLADEEQGHHDLLSNLLVSLDMPDSDRPAL